MEKQEAIALLKNKLSKHQKGKSQYLELPAGLVTLVGLPSDSVLLRGVSGLREHELVYQPVDPWFEFLGE